MSTCAPTPDTATKISRKNACSCPIGSYVPRWKNVTAVRTQSDCTDPTTKATAVADGSTIPAARHDIGYVVNDGDTTTCGSPAGNFCGKCGGWLAAGDYSGLSAQEVTAGTDDIVAGATPDATHYTVDHNSYQAYPAAAMSFFQVGDVAKIVTVGSSAAAWTAMGAVGTPVVGLIFTVTATGSGDGTAQLMRDMVMARRRGGQWIFAQKFWHGVFPWTSPDSCAVLATNAPDQTKYLTITAIAALSYEHYYLAATYGEVITDKEVGSISGSISVGQKTGIKTSSLYTEYVISYNYTYPYGSTLTETSNIHGGAGFSESGTFNKGGTTPLDSTAGASPNCISDVPEVDRWVDYWNGNVASLDPSNLQPDSRIIKPDSRYGGWSGSWDFTTTYTDPDDFTTKTKTGNIAITVVRTDTVYSWDISMNAYFSGSPDAGYGRSIVTSSGSLSLSNAYSATDFATDFELALSAWNMSDFNLASLRLDENLSHAALCTYDEFQSAISPIGWNTYTLDDFSSPANDDNGYAPWTYANGGSSPGTGWTEGPVGQTSDWTPTWNQMAWHDPNDYIWQTQALPANGIYGRMPPSDPADSATATLRTGLYSGSIIAHTAPHLLPSLDSLGITDRHFWFNAVNYRREPNYTEPGHIPDGTYDWNPYSHGAYSDGQLPWPTMRWLPGYLEQFDLAFHVAAGHNPPNGTFGQQFTDFPSADSVAPQGMLVGGKYCQAVQKWQSVNFGRPCGIDRYAVDQTTVCGVVSGSAPNFVVCQTGISTNNQPAFVAKAPLATGGIAVDDYIIVEGDGVYKITGITTHSADAFGRANWSVTVGSRLDTLPTGYAFSDPEQRTDGYTHLGRIRWLGYTQYGGTFASAPGIDLRAAVTTSYAAGILTVNSAGGLPYFRKGTDAALRAVNLYDSTMTLLNGTPLVLARTDDNNFTATTTNYPTAAWMMDTQFATAISAGATTDWTKYDGTSKLTGVHIGWSFNQRMVAAAALVVNTPWTALATVAAGAVIIDSNSNFQSTSAGGVSGATAPTWATSGNTTDGTVTWTVVGGHITAAQFNTAFAPVTYPPTWIGGSSPVAGVLDSGYSIAQFNYGGTMACPAIVGIVPDGSPENFGAGQVLFGFPTVPVDSIYGAHSQSYVGLTMEDPFDQPPFKPDCDYDPTASPACPWSWREDDGSGQLDCNYGVCDPTYSGSCSSLQIAYYAMRPMVEALSSIPGGCSLPSGVTLFYDPANKFPPPNYPNGIPLGANVTSDWGITNRICNNVSRFVADYAVWATCP